MNCSSCATPLAPQATFCKTCGRLVEDPLIGTMLTGRYRIQAKIAVGGFGAIYRGTQVNNNRRVAIKVMHRELGNDEQLVARFRREAAALCSLRDAHTVTTYELDQTADGRLFIVMELLEGRNLLELFRASGR
ncbi:MAG TPA: protein kinase, partial [Kofleriaceae bacterium]|nr:protein kinase [Kofleriaceae bacterium]